MFRDYRSSAWEMIPSSQGWWREKRDGAQVESWQDSTVEMKDAPGRGCGTSRCVQGQGRHLGRNNLEQELVGHGLFGANECSRLHLQHL